MKWIWIILALVYVLSPYDAIPGLSAISWIDDFFILFLLYRYLSKFNRMRDHGRAPYSEQQHQQEYQTNQAPDDNLDHKTPHEILEVGPDATQEEIKSSYRRLVSQYHPDKVSHLGEEFRKLAEQRFKEIQEAYQKLIP